MIGEKPEGAFKAKLLSRSIAPAQLPDCANELAQSKA